MIVALNRDILTAALGLAAKGVPVFPVATNKVPLTRAGFKDASTTAETVRGWWRRWPEALVGIATGAASGIDVLDLDRQHGAAVWWSANRARIPITRTHRTRSGGLHMFFRHRPGLRCSTARIAPGVDVKAESGCCLWWPAIGLPVLADAPLDTLSDWPGWLVEAAMPAPRPLPTYTRPPAPLTGDRAERYAQGALRAAADRVAQAPAGQRNVTLNAEAYGLARFVAEGSLDPQQIADTLALAALSAGLDRREVVGTIASALIAGGVQ